MALFWGVFSISINSFKKIYAPNGNIHVGFSGLRINYVGYVRSDGGDNYELG
jgi:hypothetical protein